MHTIYSYNNPLIVIKVLMIENIDIVLANRQIIIK